MTSDEMMIELRAAKAWPPPMEALVAAGYPLCEELGAICDDPVSAGSSIVRAHRIEDAVREFVARAAVAGLETGEEE